MICSKNDCFKHIFAFIVVFVGSFNSSAQCLQNYSWATWDKFAGKSSTGTVIANGRQIGLTMTANYEFDSTSSIYLFEGLFKSFSGYSQIKNSTVPRTTWAAGDGGKTTICFSEPVTNPILLFSSLGNEQSPVKLSFSEEYTSIFDGGSVIFLDNYSLIGREGHCIIIFPGTFTCLTINSTTPEYFTNITWGLAIIPLKISGDATGCGSVTLTANGAETYQWSGGETPNSSTNTFKTSGVYKLTATDKNGCSAVLLKKVTVIPKKNINALINQTICQGQTYLGYKSSGIYIDTLKTIDGCDSLRTLNLRVLDKPKLQLDGDICLKSPLLLSSGLSDKNLKYLWTPSNTTDSTLSVSASGQYQVRVTSPQGCEATRIINVLDKPKLQLDGDICLKSPLLLSSGLSDKNLKYLWIPSNTTDSTLSVSASGQYQVRATSPQGCEATRIIDVLDTPIVELGADRNICEGETIELIPNITSNGALKYRWETGETTRNLKINRTGKYKLTVSQLSCFASDSMQLFVNPNPKIAKKDSYCLNKPFTIGDNNNNLSYFWEYSAQTSPTVTIPNAGVYKVKITNQFRCFVIEPITIINCNGKVFAPNTFTPNGDGNNDVFKGFVSNGTILGFDIYNRWGNPIYTNNINFEWDGSTEGRASPADTFIYVLRYKNIFDNVEYQYFGQILLIR